jgi:hypothetical protein
MSFHLFIVQHRPPLRNEKKTHNNRKINLQKPISKHVMMPRGISLRHRKMRLKHCFVSPSLKIQPTHQSSLLFLSTSITIVNIFIISPESSQALSSEKQILLGQALAKDGHQSFTITFDVLWSEPNLCTKKKVVIEFIPTS